MVRRDEAEEVLQEERSRDQEPRDEHDADREHGPAGEEAGVPPEPGTDDRVRAAGARDVPRESSVDEREPDRTHAGDEKGERCERADLRRDHRRDHDGRDLRGGHAE